MDWTKCMSFKRRWCLTSAGHAGIQEWVASSVMHGTISAHDSYRTSELLRLTASELGCIATQDRLYLIRPCDDDPI